MRHHGTPMFSMNHLEKLSHEDHLAEMQSCKIVSQGPLRKESPHQKLSRLTNSKDGAFRGDGTGAVLSVHPSGVPLAEADLLATTASVDRSGSPPVRMRTTKQQNIFGLAVASPVSTVNGGGGGGFNQSYALTPLLGASAVPQLPLVHNHAREGTYQLYKLGKDDEAEEEQLIKGRHGVSGRVEIQALRAERARQRFSKDVAKMELNKKTKPPAPMPLPDLEEEAMKSIPNHLRRLRAGAGEKSATGRGGFDSRKKEDDEYGADDSEPIPFVVDPMNEREVKACLQGEIARTDRIVVNRRIRPKELAGGNSSNHREDPPSRSALTNNSEVGGNSKEVRSLKEHPKAAHFAAQTSSMLRIAGGGGDANSAGASGRKSAVIWGDEESESTTGLQLEPFTDIPMLALNTTTTTTSGIITTAVVAKTTNSSAPTTADPDVERAAITSRSNSAKKLTRTGSTASHASNHSLTHAAGSKTSRSFRGVMYPAEAEVNGGEGNEMLAPNSMVTRLGLGKAEASTRRRSTVFHLTDQGHMVKPPSKRGSQLAAVDSDDEQSDSYTVHSGEDSGGEGGDNATFLTHTRTKVRTRVEGIRRKSSSVRKRSAVVSESGGALTAREFSVQQRKALLQVAPEDFIRLRGEDRHAQTYRKGRYDIPVKERVAVHNSDHVMRFLAGLDLRTHEFNESAMEELDRVRDAQKKFRAKKAAGFNEALSDPGMMNAPASRLLEFVRHNLAEACRLKDFNGRLNVYREHINRLERFAVDDFDSDELLGIVLDFLQSVRKVVEKTKGHQDLELFMELCTKDGGIDKKTGKDHPILPKDHVAVPAEALMINSVSSFLGIVAPMFGIEATTYNHWLEGMKRRFEGRDFANEIQFRKVEMGLGRDMSTEIKFKLTVHTARGVNMQAFSNSAGAVNGKPPVFVKVSAERGSHITKASFSTIPKWNDTFNVHMLNEQSPVNFKLIIGDDEVASGFMMAARFKEQGEIILKQQQNQASIAQAASGGSPTSHARTGRGGGKKSPAETVGQPGDSKMRKASTARGPVKSGAITPRRRGTTTTGDGDGNSLGNSQKRVTAQSVREGAGGTARKRGPHPPTKSSSSSTTTAPPALAGIPDPPTPSSTRAGGKKGGSSPGQLQSSPGGKTTTSQGTTMVVTKGPPQKATVALVGSLVTSAEVIITVEVLTTKLVGGGTTTTTSPPQSPLTTVTPRKEKEEDATE